MKELRTLKELKAAIRKADYVTVRLGNTETYVIAQKQCLINTITQQQAQGETMIRDYDGNETFAQLHDTGYVSIDTL